MRIRGAVFTVMVCAFLAEHIAKHWFYIALLVIMLFNQTPVCH